MNIIVIIVIIIDGLSFRIELFRGISVLNSRTVGTRLSALRRFELIGKDYNIR